MDYKKITKEDTWGAFQMHVLSGMSMDDVLGTSPKARRAYLEDSLTTALLSTANIIMTESNVSLYAAAQEIFTAMDEEDESELYYGITQHLTLLNKQINTPKGLYERMVKFAKLHGTNL